mgnify:CR=1 FL=1
MTITEAERFQMHEALSTAHGKEVAAIIMEHLPPTGWGDVARRSDVADLRVQLAEHEMPAWPYAGAIALVEPTATTADWPSPISWSNRPTARLTQ